MLLQIMGMLLTELTFDVALAHMASERTKQMCIREAKRIVY